MAEAASLPDKARIDDATRTYWFLIVGCLLWPLMFVVLSRTSKLLKEADYMATHAVFQRRTVFVYLGLLAIWSIVILAVVLLIDDPFLRRSVATVTSNCGALVVLALAVRSVRGLQLAAAGSPIARPNSFGLWPDSKVAA